MDFNILVTLSDLDKPKMDIELCGADVDIAPINKFILWTRDFLNNLHWMYSRWAVYDKGFQTKKLLENKPSLTIANAKEQLSQCNKSEKIHVVV